MLLAAIAGLIAPEVAHACGGCFSMPPPVPTPEAVQTVTYHRMALSVSSSRTVLWDQFGYTGRPQEFSWILPIQGGPEVRVELADVRFLAALDDASAALVDPPPQVPSRSCPYCYVPPPEVNYYCSSPSSGPWGRFGSDAAFASIDASAPSDSSVTVLREEVVGPYQVVTLRGDDAMSLRQWLTTNNYAVPPALEPVLSHYIGLRMDFVALRLRDGVGLGRMQPVRVTMPGSQPVLPLRMVAAGVADEVELVLFTVAESRLEPTNFPAIELGNAGLSWVFGRDGNTQAAFRRNEAELRATTGGRGWLTESAVTSSRQALQTVASLASQRWRAESPMVTPEADMAVAIDHLAGAPVLTRLHATLGIAALDRDLTLGPSARGDHARGYRFGRTEGTSTPAACPALSCATGLVAGGEGEIVDPFGASLPPGSVLPASYVRGSLPAFTSVWHDRPRYMDGRAYTQPPTRHVEHCGTFDRNGVPIRGCSVSRAGSRSSSSLGGALIGLLALGFVARRSARRARRS